MLNGKKVMKVKVDKLGRHVCALVIDLDDGTRLRVEADIYGMKLFDPESQRWSVVHPDNFRQEG